MIKKIYIVVFLATLTSCATTEKYEARLQSWVGKQEENLIMSWGAPHKVHEISQNKKVVSYQQNHTSSSIQFFCETNFLIKDNIIDTWTWRGNNCASY